MIEPISTTQYHHGFVSLFEDVWPIVTGDFTTFGSIWGGAAGVSGIGKSTTDGVEGGSGIMGVGLT